MGSKRVWMVVLRRSLTSLRSCWHCGQIGGATARFVRRFFRAPGARFPGRRAAVILPSGRGFRRPRQASGVVGRLNSRASVPAPQAGAIQEAEGSHDGDGHGNKASCRFLKPNSPSAKADLRLVSVVLKSHFYWCFNGTDGGGRTHTSVKTQDFESSASANSATSAALITNKLLNESSSGTDFVPLIVPLLWPAVHSNTIPSDYTRTLNP